MSSVTFKTMMIIFRHFLNYFPLRSNITVENNRAKMILLIHFFKFLSSALLKSMGTFHLV